MRRWRHPLAFAAALLVASACSYDYTSIPRTLDTDGGTPGLDGGPDVRCDPLENTSCPALQTCSAELDSSRRLIARCTTVGTSASGAGCDGVGVCAPGLFCLSSGSDSQICSYVCSDGEDCPGALSCDRSTTLFTLGTRTVYRCR